MLIPYTIKLPFLSRPVKTPLPHKGKFVSCLNALRCNSRECQVEQETFCSTEEATRKHFRHNKPQTPPEQSRATMMNSETVRNGGLAWLGSGGPCFLDSAAVQAGGAEPWLSSFCLPLPNSPEPAPRSVGFPIFPSTHAAVVARPVHHGLVVRRIPCEGKGRASQFQLLQPKARGFPLQLLGRCPVPALQRRLSLSRRSPALPALLPRPSHLALP